MGISCADCRNEPGESQIAALDSRGLSLNQHRGTMCPPHWISVHISAKYPTPFSEGHLCSAALSGSGMVAEVTRKVATFAE